MAEIIEKLIGLQAKDNELDAITSRIAAIPEEVDTIKNQADVLNAGLKEKEEDYKKQAVAQQDLENDIRKLNEEIKKSQSELYAVKTNDLYKTILEGIKDKKNKVSDAETSLLELMDRVDDAKKSFTALKEDVARQTDDMNSRCLALNAEKDASTVEFGAKKVARDESVSNMKSEGAIAKSLEQYERIRKSKGGVAVVKVKDGNACGGCNIALTRQQIIEVASSDIVVCENCGRMLCA
ncbi:MAG: C4-type zinc ribbon domain-containing protein [Elusimicrobiota bacterium]|nr:C4-type zinc ribbon domain-containing protein [Elusimicrobiota bacterium]